MSLPRACTTRDTTLHRMKTRLLVVHYYGVACPYPQNEKIRMIQSQIKSKAIGMRVDPGKGNRLCGSFSSPTPPLCAARGPRTIRRIHADSKRDRPNANGRNPHSCAKSPEHAPEDMDLQVGTCRPTYPTCSSHQATCSQHNGHQRPRG